MTIDEMILKLKSDAVLDSYNFQGYSREQKNQIAEWLKELKEMWKNQGMVSDFWYLEGYNKAIDDVTKLVEFLIADLDVEGCTKYGNENAEQEKKSYDTLMKYEIAGSIDDLLDRLERLKN